MGSAWSGERRNVLPLVGSGAYRVGCVDLMLADTADGDSGVFMRVFYPSDHTDQSPSERPSHDYPVWLPRKEYLDGLASYLKQSTTRLQFFSDWLIGEKRCPALWRPPLSGSCSSLPSSASMPTISASPRKMASSQSLSLSQDNFPVVVFSHGLAGCRHFYSVYCASLASYGYVVAAVEHRDYSACWTYRLVKDTLSTFFKERPLTMRILESGDKEFKIRNQQLGKRVSECVKALHVLEELNLGTLKAANIVLGNDFNWSCFKGRLNMSRSAVIGHSFGGATAIASTAVSTDFQTAIVLDGWMFPLEADHYSRALQPTLLLNASRWQWKANLQSMKRLSDEAERVTFSLNEAVHQSFSDFSFLCSPFFGRRLGLQAEAPPQYVMESVVDTSVTFLRKVHEGEAAGPAVRQLIKEKYAATITEGTAIDNDEAHL